MTIFRTIAVLLATTLLVGFGTAQAASKTTPDAEAGCGDHGCRMEPIPVAAAQFVCTPYNDYGLPDVVLTRGNVAGQALVSGVEFPGDPPVLFTKRAHLGPETRQALRALHVDKVLIVGRAKLLDATSLERQLRHVVPLPKGGLRVARVRADSVAEVASNVTVRYAKFFNHRECLKAPPKK